MNVAFVNSTRKWGGVKTWCLVMAQALRAMGHGAMVAGRPGEFLERAAAMGLPAVAEHFGPDFNPLAVGRFVWLFRRHGVDAVVVNVSKDLRTAGVAARLLGLPVLQHLGQGGDLRDTWRTRLDLRLWRPLLVPCCRHVEAGVRRALPWLRDDQLRTIANGVDLGAAPQAPRPAGRPLTLVATSQLNPDKGHADLLAACARLADQGLAFRLVVYGRGSAEEQLKAMAARLGLPVEFRGFTADVRAALRQADVFVLPSLAEGLPMSLMEAMAEGLAPVARNVGGVAEVWPQGCGELLVDPAPGHAALAGALETVLTAPDERLAAWRSASLLACRQHCDALAKAGELLAAITSWRV